MRLAHLLPFGALLFCLIPACGDNDSKPPGDDAAGAGGEGGDSAGKSSTGGKASGGTRAGDAGDPSVAGTPSEGGTGGYATNPVEAGGGPGPDRGGGPSVGAGGGGAGGEGPEPVDCSRLATAPAQFEVFTGFTGAEDFPFDELGNEVGGRDFAFDGLGNYVGVDDSNLVRISKDGKRVLWAPNVGKRTAGMAILPDGSVILADVTNGALERTYPSSVSETVIDGLLYPKGLDIGPDGYVYVCENSAGRVRRVNPDDGAFTIVAMGLEGCSSVAFSSDPKLLYIGSFEGSGVYKVEIPAPGELGVASVFARPPGSRLPPPKVACPDQEVGKDCTTTTGNRPGKCRQLSNVVDCVPVGPCDDVAEGGDCQGGGGTCQAGSCIPKGCEDPEDPTCCQGPACPPIDPCDGLSDGDTCSDEFGVVGKCVDVGAANLFCEPPPPCDGSNAGDVCDLQVPWGEQGECVDFDGRLSCQPLEPCESLSAGDVCTFPSGGEGKCVDFKGQLSCTRPGPCDGLNEGDACTMQWEEKEGECVDKGTQLDCELDPCDGLSVGDVCDGFWGGEGKCFDLGGKNLSCLIPGPCHGKQDGDECTSPDTGRGTCLRSGDDALLCEPVDPCKGLTAGDECIDSTGAEGTCVEFSPGDLKCAPPNACAGLTAGDNCVDPMGKGNCVELSSGYLYCDVPWPCDGSNAGDLCWTPDFGDGVCMRADPGLYCGPPLCKEASPGDYCATVGGLPGECQGSTDGPLACVAPCEGKPNGSECMLDEGVGQCQLGYCTTRCTEDNAGEPCLAAKASGFCAEENGKFVCQPTTGVGGGIGGLGVDACGYVYATESVYGYVWRISPEGDIELLARLPADPSVSIKWGRDVGGFSKDVMYVADHSQRRRLFAIDVGVPGVTEYYDLVSQ
jgi:hypothetical protein